MLMADVPNHHTPPPQHAPKYYYLNIDLLQNHTGTSGVTSLRQ